MGDRRSSRRRAVLTGAGIVALVVALRVAVEPKPVSLSPPALDEAARAEAYATLRASRVDRDTLLAKLAGLRVILVGESHFFAEPPSWLVELLGDLNARDGRSAVLVLELPAAMQADIEAYLRDGDDAVLAAAWPRHALPYQSVIRWARAHPEAVRRIVAADEDLPHLIAMRAVGTDTRNATMAAALLRATREDPDARVVAYGGEVHMTLAGRYMYDAPSRRPAGARLLDAGVSRREVAAIWLLVGHVPALGLWPERATVAFDGLAGALPLGLLRADVAGADRLRELVDFAVYLGPGTRGARD